MARFTSTDIINKGSMDVHLPFGLLFLSDPDIRSYPTT